MSNILKMTRLDFSLIRPYFKSYLIVLLVPVIVIFSTQDIISGVIFFMNMMAMTSSYTFSIAEKNDLNRLYGLLPVTKKEIVIGRYMFTALTGTTTALIGVMLNIAVLTVTKKPYSWEEAIIGVSAGLALYTLFTAIQLPGFFKFGAIKGRFFAFIPFAGMFSAGVIAGSIRPGDINRFPDITVLNNTTALFAVSILLDILLYCISIGISQKLFDGMDL